MDGREGMTLSGGSAQFYMHRGGGGGSVSAAQTGGFHSPPGFRVLPNPNTGQAQSNVRGGSDGSPFSMEAPHTHTNFAQGMNMGMSSGVPQSEPVKKKRGRPRKYAPDGSGSVSLRLSPMSAPNSSTSLSSPTPKRNRGRPPGTGRKQQLAALGEWMNSSAGIAFAPYVVHAAPGEDIAAKIMSFAQQRPRAICILSGSGAVSSVTLRQPTSSGGSITYEGRFEILCLSGSYVVAEDGDPQGRTGGVSVSLSSPEGRVVGGSVGMLIAASPVQVVLCTFVYGGARSKSKQLNSPKGEKNSEPEPQHVKSVMPIQSITPSPMNAWPGSQSVDLRNPRTDIDLTR